MYVCVRVCTYDPLSEFAKPLAVGRFPGAPQLGVQGWRGAALPLQRVREKPLLHRQDAANGVGAPVDDKLAAGWRPRAQQWGQEVCGSDPQTRQ